MSNTECLGQNVGLALTCMALVISLCLNVFLCLLRHQKNGRREGLTKLTSEETEELYPYAYHGNRFEAEEHPCFLQVDDIQLQENPIYGNIDANRGLAEGHADSMCYESMVAGPHTGDVKEPVVPDLNYASLDLDVAKKHKKKRRYQQRGPGQQQAELQSRLSQPLSPEVEASLPSKHSSPMASRNSIYLNSQQMALEAEERDRERERKKGRSRDRSRKYARDEGDEWEGHREWERARGRDWRADEVGEGGLCREMDGDGDGLVRGAEEVQMIVSENLDYCSHPSD